MSEQRTTSSCTNLACALLSLRVMTSEMRKATWRGLDGRLPDSHEQRRETPLSPSTQSSDNADSRAQPPTEDLLPATDKPD